MSPPLHNIVHVAVKFAMVVAERRVVKDTVDVVKDLVHWDFGMLPGINDPWSYVLKDCGCNLTGRLVENVGKVVFREERMCGIRTVWVRPGLILVFAAGIDYA